MNARGLNYMQKQNVRKRIINSILGVGVGIAAWFGTAFYNSIDNHIKQ